MLSLHIEILSRRQRVKVLPRLEKIYDDDDDEVSRFQM